MGMLIAVVLIGFGGFAIGSAGGAYAGRTHQWLLATAGTVGSYYLVVGIPWAWLIMESDSATPLRAFAEAFVALARTLLLLGLIPLAITFVISALIAR